MLDSARSCAIGGICVVFTGNIAPYYLETRGLADIPYEKWAIIRQIHFQLGFVDNGAESSIFVAGYYLDHVVVLLILLNLTWFVYIWQHFTFWGILCVFNVIITWQSRGFGRN